MRVSLHTLPDVARRRGFHVALVLRPAGDKVNKVKGITSRNAFKGILFPLPLFFFSLTPFLPSAPRIELTRLFSMGPTPRSDKVALRQA